VEGIFKICDEDEIKLFVGLARKIWFRRNEVLHGGSFTHPNVLVQRAMSSVAEFLHANTLEEHGHKEERRERLVHYQNVDVDKDLSQIKRVLFLFLG
jgi:hypothetical protein